jgi:hypothetical protein
MGKLGIYLAIFGLVSIVLSFLNMNLKILIWIDMWGETMGWTIRIGMIVVGLLIAFLSFKRDAIKQKKKD